MHDVSSILVPVGMSIAIIVNVVLLYLSVKSFKRREIFPQIKISTVLVFVTIILYDIGTILRKSVVLRHRCTIREPIAFSTLFLARATLYYFFIIRMEFTFAGSGMKFSPKFIAALKITTVTVYGLSALYFIVDANHQVYNAEHSSCEPSDEIYNIYLIVITIFGVVDLLLGVVICSAYLYRLYTVYKLFKTTANINNDTVDNNTSTVQTQTLLNLIKKQAKLAFIAYISTFVLVYLAPPMGLRNVSYIDSIVNALCVYCTFDIDWNQNIYRYLCNCNGNKYLQYLFCFCCCCCCNESISNDGNVQIDVKDASNIKAASSSVSNEMSNQSSNDTANQTIETIMH